MNNVYIAFVHPFFAHGNVDEAIAAMVRSVRIIDKILWSLEVGRHHLIENFILLLGTQHMLLCPPPNVVWFAPKMLMPTSSGSNPSAPVQSIETAKHRLVRSEGTLAMCVIDYTSSLGQLVGRWLRRQKTQSTANHIFGQLQRAWWRRNWFNLLQSNLQNIPFNEFSKNEKLILFELR